MDKDLYKEGWKYITCYDDGNGHLIPMGNAKDIEYGLCIAKRHKHVLCKLEIISDFRENLIDIDLGSGMD